MNRSCLPLLIASGGDRVHGRSMTRARRPRVLVSHFLYALRVIFYFRLYSPVNIRSRETRRTDAGERHLDGGHGGRTVGRLMILGSFFSHGIVLIQ